MQLAIRISKNHAFRTCTTPLRTFRPILRSIGLLGIEIPRKEIISTDDRLMDGQTSRRTTIGSFFENRKKLLKMVNIILNICTVICSMISNECQGSHILSLCKLINLIHLIDSLD